MKWFVLYTRSNFELKVSRSLKDMGFETYCPMYRQIKKYSDRKKIVEKPILRSYVFVKIDDKDRDQVFDIMGVIRYVFWLGKPAIVREQEIELMKNALRGVFTNILVSNLNIGNTYDIPEGPFKGHQGKVVNFSKNRIKLKLPSLGILVSLKTC